jgi:tight adherence protein B
VRLLMIAVVLWVLGTRISGHGRLRHRFVGQLEQRDAAALLAGALDEVGRQLRGGASLDDAIRSGADRGAALLRQLIELLDRGVLLPDAIGTVADQSAVGSDDSLVATALGFAHDCGGPAAELIDGLAASVRQRDRARRELRALLSPVKASAVLVSLAPLGVALLVLLLDRGVLRAAVGQPVTAVAMGVGLMLEAGGVWWMHRIAARVAPVGSVPT